MANYSGFKYEELKVKGEKCNLETIEGRRILNKLSAFLRFWKKMMRLLHSRLVSLSYVPLNSLPTSFSAATGRSSTRVAEILRNLDDVSPNKNILNGFRTFCTAKDLTIKKCVPCNAKDLRPMKEEAANILMQQVPEWKMENDNGVLKLNRSWKVKSFTKGLEFFEAIASLAEAEGHHPDLHLVGWNNVKIDIWTHAVGGLTENDFILAAKINQLNLHHLLRKAPTSE